jgi:drug/metabolite transporter (DMT)-like permease
VKYLVVVSFIWAFSFGLIKGQLVGLDPNFVSFARMAISFLFFLPFLKINKIERVYIPRLLLVGALQYGMMYLAYIYAFQFLKAYEIALFTIFTPIFVTLLNDIFHKKFSVLHFFSALLAVIGTGIVMYREFTREGFLLGFWIVQISNFCFAYGQIYYRELMGRLKGIKDQEVFGVLYLGAVLLTGIAASLTTDWLTLQVGATQWWTLLYLGIVASGIGFFLWNVGARKVNAGSLAVFNNLKVPLAVAVSVLVFGESIDLLRLLIGGGIVLAALGVNEFYPRFRRQLKRKKSMLL